MDGGVTLCSRTETASRWIGRALAACVVAAPAMAGATSLDLYYERTVMRVADARCGLFPASVGAALDASRAQARGAALRAGIGKSQLITAEQHAQARAGAVACDSADMKLAAGRVRKAFEGYSKLIRMDYPGDQTAWRADRSVSVKGARWRLTQWQTDGAGRMIFGLVGRDGVDALMAVIGFTDGRSPYGARLAMRDDRITVGPYLNSKGQTLAKTPLAQRLSPTGTQIAFQAQARSLAADDLRPKDMKTAWAFRFSSQAAQALAGLDPREAIAVDFLFADDSARRIYVEVGDFAAGRAFLQVAAR